MPERNDLVPFENEIARQQRKYATATDDEIAELSETFPEAFVDYVRRRGWCSMAGELFWTVSPRYLAPALADWQLDAPVQAFGRNALGDLYVLCHGRVLTLYADGYTHALRSNVLGFLNYGLDLTDRLRRSDVKRLRRELGPLNWDECYTYSPALAIKAVVERRADKGKLLPYVSIVGQLVAPVPIAESVDLAGRPLEPVELDEETDRELKSLLEKAKANVERRKREKGY